MQNQKDYTEQDISTALYQLSQLPQFNAIYELMRRVAEKAYAPFPRTEDQKVAYESWNSVQNVLHELTRGLDVEIDIGRRLATPNPGGDADASDGTDQRRRT